MTSDDQDLAAVLSEFARTMVTDFPIQSILDQLVERIVEILPITAAGVTLISPGSRPLYIAASDESAMRFEELQTELGEGPCQLAYETGEAVTVADLGLEHRFPNFTARALVAGLVAVFTFPLRRGATQLGALDLYRETAGALSLEALAAAQTLADVAAAYLVNAQVRDDLQDSSDRSRAAALHDALTGLPNRVLMLERIEHAFLRERRSAKSLGLLFVDLDRFKAVNDSFGHQAGDELLIAVAKRLSEAIRPGDTLARLAGDEFVVLCEDLDNVSQADLIAIRLGKAMTQPFDLSGRHVELSASVGIAFAGSAERDPEHLLHDADTAMYQAKRQGGGHHQVLNRDAMRLLEDNAGLELDLRRALERNELHVEYQPIVTSAQGRIIGIEALMRWEHPQRGAVSPATLIPIAEQSGQITEIGRFVLEQAWADRSRWQHPDRHDDLAMSVNVSAHQLLSAGFTDTVAAVLDTNEADARLLTLEITESIFVRDSHRALMVLNDLKSLGVTLALDDFGTGYSSLSYLDQFPVDIVKIDQTFVAGLRRVPSSPLIIAAVVQLAHGLQLTVVAEGVETIEQYHDVIALGCDFSQGYYFARPMTATSLDTLIHHRLDIRDPRLPAPA